MSDVPKPPNCYSCRSRRNVAGSYHSACADHLAKVEGDKWGKEHGWFYWPNNYDPIWLVSCDSFKSRETKEPT